MLPSRFVFLDSLPLNSNGKSDRRRLSTVPVPPPASSRPAIQDAVESGLIEIWRGLFRGAEVTPVSNFFDLGGHSLKALQMIHRIETTLGKTLTIPELFEEPTIAQIAERLRKQDSSSKCVESDIAGKSASSQAVSTPSIT